MSDDEKETTVVLGALKLQKPSTFPRADLFLRLGAGSPRGDLEIRLTLSEAAPRPVFLMRQMTEANAAEVGALLEKLGVPSALFIDR